MWKLRLEQRRISSLSPRSRIPQHLLRYYSCRVRDRTRCTTPFRFRKLRKSAHRLSFFSPFFPTCYLNNPQHISSPHRLERQESGSPDVPVQKRRALYPSTVALSPIHQPHRWPGCLDVTVGGGMGLNETALS